MIIDVIKKFLSIVKLTNDIKSDVMIINKDYFKNKILLITGGTGSIGNAIINYFIKHKIKLKIIIYSRDEWKQYEMENKFRFNHNQNLRFYIGDVRDKDRLRRAMDDVDLVIHAAALKQVDKAELDYGGNKNKY